ncbi:DEAD/DEAH box helicase, partial [Aeromonas hydrophila]
MSIASFADLALSPRLQQTLTELGYAAPTPVQASAIPVILAGRDLMAGAQTGTGKTAAFALPLLEQLLQNPTNDAPCPIRALVLVPTR